jgi:hypothetical protein
MQTYDPNTQLHPRVPRVVNRTEAIRVQRHLSMLRKEPVFEMTAKQAPHLWAEFLMTDAEADSVVLAHNIFVREL